MNSDYRCETCRFWEKTGSADSIEGYCLRYPPTPNLRDLLNGVWPVTDNCDWCGEYKEK